MKKSLTVFSLLAAASTGAMAWSNIDDGLAGYDYSTSMNLNNTHLDNRGSNSVSGVSNYGWNEATIDLGKDAHYEISFKIYAQTVNDSQNPMFHIYLAGSSTSIIFGNYIDQNFNGANYLDGYAGVYTCNKNVSGLDCSNGQYGSVVLNYDIQQRPGVQGTSVSRFGDVGWSVGKELVTGFHTYTIDIETFADSSQQDIIKFKYTGANAPTGNWSQDYKLQEKISGIGDSEKLAIGTFFADNGGDIALYNGLDITGLNQTLVVQERTEPKPVVPPPAPEPTPEPDPAVPEPSAFGLLAGLGALALVASRRRRK